MRKGFIKILFFSALVIGLSITTVFGQQQDPKTPKKPKENVPVIVPKEKPPKNDEREKRPKKPENYSTFIREKAEIDWV